MSEYTPTTSEVREAYAKRRALYLAASGHVLSNDAKYDREDYAEFDRWLTAHDAEVRADEAAQWAQAVLVSGLQGERIGSARAGVVAEEPEWEVGVTYSTPSGPSIDGYRMRSYMKVESVEKAREFAKLVERPMIQKRTKAVPAGEWVSVPVKQEGATDA